MGRETENVDVAFEMILQAANEYEGYILGMPESDVITGILNEVNEEKNRNYGDSEARKIRDLITRIIDRTTAAPQLDEIAETLKNRWGDINFSGNFRGGPAGHEDIIRVVHKGAGDESGQYRIKKEFAQAGEAPAGSNLENEYLEFKNKEMAHIVRYIDPRKVSKRAPTAEDQAPPAAEATAANSRGQVERTISGTTVAESEIDLSQIPPESFNNSNELSVSSPNLGAVIIKDPRFSFSSKNSNHMPVFLSAITPIEMSRCTPYLDIKVMSRQQSSFNKMGIYNFLRVTDDQKENSGTAFFNPRPVDIDPVKSEGDEFFNYMDLFTSPQTMVNANINKQWFGERNYKNFSNSLSNLFSEKGDKRTGKDFFYSSVNDPFQPFMTLLGLNVSVSGIGYGLLATKVASLRIKLHDKSRIKDLSPLLAPEEFSKTKFIIEFGWSHPDGAVTSNNTLGQYLNALRDTNVYQLQGADYSFGDDNTVDITLRLVCAGFSYLQSVSAAAGKLISIKNVAREIQDTLDFILGTGEGSLSDDRIEEIRGTLRISNQDFSRLGSLSDFDKVSEFKKKSEEYRKSLLAEKLGGLTGLLNVLQNEIASPEEEVLRKIIEIVYNFENNAETDLSKIVAQLKSGEGNFSYENLDEKLINAGDITYAKLRSLPYGIDPFRGQVSTNYIAHLKSLMDPVTSFIDDMPLIGVVGDPNTSYNSLKSKDKHVSLGKIISSFIGYPLSTSLQYAEVQLFFYPVNSHAAAASKHTTASLPISLKMLEKEIEKRVLSNEQSFRNLSVQTFFNMIDSIVQNEQLPAYGMYPENISSINERIEAFEKKSEEEKYAEATGADGLGADVARLEDEAAAAYAEQTAEGGGSEREKEQYVAAQIIDTYRQKLQQELTNASSSRVNTIYDAETPSTGDQPVKAAYLDRDKFKHINLSMFFETVPAKQKSKMGDSNDPPKKRIIDFYKSKKDDRREVTARGIDHKNSILRIHIYDENATMNPDLGYFGSGFSNTNGQPTSNVILDNLLSYSYVKDLLMTYHPTIIHGSSTGVINNIRVSGNTTGQHANILIAESYLELNNKKDDKDIGDSGFDETVFLPTTVSLEMMGFPMLARGQQIFIDFGTQTSLDNLYSVKSIEHSIQAGIFKTTATLQATNQMIVTAYRDRLKTMVARAIDKGNV